MIGEALGTCNCGGVKFKVDRAPQEVYVCHCSICRKATGSGGIAVTIVPKAEFTWLEGREHIRTWENLVMIGQRISVKFVEPLCRGKTMKNQCISRRVYSTLEPMSLS